MPAVQQTTRQTTGAAPPTRRRVKGEASQNWRRVGAAVRERRVLMEMSIAEAARRAGLAAPTWAKLEHGEVRQWKPATLAAMARVLLWPDDFQRFVLEGEEVPYVDRSHEHDDAPVRGLVRWMADNLPVAALADVVAAWVATQADDALSRRTVVPLPVPVPDPDEGD